MVLSDGTIGNSYRVEDIHLPLNMEKRLEALGMTRGTPVTVLVKTCIIQNVSKKIFPPFRDKIRFICWSGSVGRAADS